MDAVSMVFQDANKKLYAYLALFRQMAARYSSQELENTVKDLEALYNVVSSPQFDTQNKALVAEEVKKLKICIINMQLQITNHEWRELKPICQYMHDLMREVEEGLC